MAPFVSAVTRVLITGFGPFSGVPVNPSWRIASKLPTSLPNDIQLLVHPSYVPVAYHPVMDLLPSLHAQEPDISLHIGVAAGRTYFAVEATSKKTGYEFSRDVDGKVFTKEEQEVAWGSEPTLHSTSLDLHAIVARWQYLTSNITFSSSDFLSSGPVAPEDVKWSDAVGSYLCGFIYYASMVEMGKHRGSEGLDVAFMHVPSLDTDEQVQAGVDVTIALVQSLVETWRAKKGGKK
ncbi:hypothetical protein B0J11DRAFT_438774 [Dendryphion nanum]|uniref:Peptidase C15, pyroglutamyl peptidase I-like protein n=1 Tax=Dendryphion nanum TaxID=256645 RepID=A0A9P9DKJ3_9PLEO|nr:hypothetical protein B0J11DRAFT_438774 [Dendryphion nanum]